MTSWTTRNKSWPRARIHQLMTIMNRWAHRRLAIGTIATSSWPGVAYPTDGSGEMGCCNA